MDSTEGFFTDYDDTGTDSEDNTEDELVSEEEFILPVAGSSCNNTDQSTTLTRKPVNEYGAEQVARTEEPLDVDKSVTLTEKGTLLCDVKDNVSTRIHHANVAFYVMDAKTKKKYAVTNRHVTLHAGTAHIKKLNRVNDVLPFGSPANIANTSDGGIDVGLIEIHHLLRDNVINTEILEQQVRIYSGPFKSIFGKDVFKYRPNTRLFELCSYDTPNTGSVASEAEHEDFCLSSGQENGQFLVKNDSGEFSVKGESGTALAVTTTGSNDIDLIGIICGGMKSYTVCHFLPTVFKHFENRYGMNLKICESEFSKLDVVNNTTPPIVSNVNVSGQADERAANLCVPFGITIYFNTPEQIAPLSFNLVDRVLNLLCLKYGNIDVKSYEKLIEKERTLSHFVSERESWQNCSVFENDKPEYVAVERGMIACDNLYKGKAQEAETCLKEAIMCVLKLDSLGLRALCKLTTYITWFCLVVNTKCYLKRLKILLQEGIDSFEHDYKDLTGFPTEALGYMYYDFSRYYMCNYDTLRRFINRQKSQKSDIKKTRQKAVEKANCSVNVFQQDHAVKNTKETLTRLVLAKCQYAYVLLGCGHEFNVLQGEVSRDDIEQAEDVINSIKLEVVDTPLVQNVNYLIALADLRYRKGSIDDALKIADKCLKISKAKEYVTVYHRANCRVKKLKRL